MIIEHVPLSWISAECPRYVHDALVRVRVRYRNFDQAVRIGELIVHRTVAAEVEELFGIMFELAFPICIIMPAHVYDFHDAVLMMSNVTSAFNFRYIYGTRRMSWHGYGLAIDINPRENPIRWRGRMHPPGAVYQPGEHGVLDAKHVVVKAFKERGWEWGGDGDEPFNPHHFQKPLPEYTR